MCRLFVLSLLFIFTVNVCCVEKAAAEAPAWWQKVEHETLVVENETVTFFKKTVPDAAHTAWQWTKNESSIVGNKTVIFFDKTVPAFFEEAGGEIKIITTEIENKTVEELEKFENFIADHCHCEGFSCACCGHLEEHQIELSATICVNITYLPKDYGITFLMTLNSYVLYNETISARSPPPFCVGIPFVKELAEICVRLYDIDATSTYLHACVRIEGRMKKILVAKYDFGCFDIGHKIGKWTMTNDVDNKVCNLQHIPIHYIVSYPETESSLGYFAVDVPMESKGEGYCNKDVWVLKITWPSPVMNTEQDFLKLTLDTGKHVTGETNVVIHFNGTEMTEVYMAKSIPDLQIPFVLLNCCYQDLSLVEEDKNAAMNFSMAVTQEDLSELSPTAKNLIWFFSGAGFILVLTIVSVIAVRRWKCCSARIMLVSNQPF